MTRLPMQRTRFQGLISRLGERLAGQVWRSWRRGSLAALALLLGFFFGQNLTSLLLITSPGGETGRGAWPAAGAGNTGAAA